MDKKSIGFSPITVYAIFIQIKKKQLITILKDTKFVIECYQIFILNHKTDFSSAAPLTF